MSSKKHAEAIYRDFEKLYRLIGIYKGNKSQMAKQVEFIGNNFDAHLREPFGAQDGVVFDLMMSSVYFEGEEVFRSKSPEFTLSYVLFCEGVKSVLFRPELTAHELFDWVLVVRDNLYSTSDHQEDLASILWRQSNTNIRVALYNSLVSAASLGVSADMQALDLPDEEQSFDEFYEKEVYEDEFGGQQFERRWHKRDEAWDLPSGDLASKGSVAMQDFDTHAGMQLRKELSDAAVSDRATRIVKFHREEVEALRSEMEHFDQNQVEFNTLVQYLDALEKALHQYPKLIHFISQSIVKIIQSIVKRFHAGLILFILRRLDQWKEHESLKDLHRQVVESLQGSLRGEENIRVLSGAFEKKNRFKLARGLLQFCDPELFDLIFMELARTNRIDGRKRFLKAALDLGVEIDQLLMKWGEEAVVAALPAVEELEWKGKARFMLRCLSSKKYAVAEQAAQLVHQMELTPNEARKIYQSAPTTIRSIWLQKLVQAPVNPAWKPFVQAGLSSGLWLQGKSELMALWIRLAFKYLKRQAFEILDPWVRERRLLIWPKHPKERTVILEVAMSLSDPILSKSVSDWASREKSLPMQSGSLKESLRERASG